MQTRPPTDRGQPNRALAPSRDRRSRTGTAHPDVAMSVRLAGGLRCQRRAVIRPSFYTRRRVVGAQASFQFEVEFPVALDRVSRLPRAGLCPSRTACSSRPRSGTTATRLVLGARPLIAVGRLPLDACCGTDTLVAALLFDRQRPRKWRNPLLARRRESLVRGHTPAFILRRDSSASVGSGSNSESAAAATKRHAVVQGHSRRHRRQSFASGRPGGTVRTGSRYQNSGAGMCWK